MEVSRDDIDELFSTFAVLGGSWAFKRLLDAVWVALGEGIITFEEEDFILGATIGLSI